MTKKQFKLAVFLTILCCCSFAMAKTNIEENDKISITFDDRWQGYFPNVENSNTLVSYTISNVSRSNGKSLLIDVPASTKPDFFHNNFDMDTTEVGEMYEFTAWIKTENVDNGVGAWVVMSGVDKSGKRITATDSERLWGTKDWTFVDVVMFIPENVEKFRVSCFLHGTGKAWFDQPKLRLLSKRPSVENVKNINIQITDHKTIPAKQFIGFGLEDDCFFFMDDNFRHGITDAEVELREHRISELDPKVISTIFWWQSICPSNNIDKITFDTDLMRNMYRMLDTHQTAGREVVFSDVFWGWAHRTFPYDEKHLELGVETYFKLLHHLIKEKGYTCIKTVSISGEVDMRWVREFGGTFDSYIKACRLFRKKLDENGLGHVKLVCDKVTGTVWFERVIAEADEAFNIFTVHEYPDVKQYPQVRNRLEKALTAIHKHSKPIGKSKDGPIYKPTFLWEIGYCNFEASDPVGESSVVRTHRYGLLCGHSCNSALNAGICGGSVWNLQQMYYPGAPQPQTWGFWDFKSNGWKIRPNYYAYGLYSRFINAGDQPLEVKASPNCYDLSASALSDDKGNRMLYLINLSNSKAKCKINGLPEKVYTIYEYAEGNLPKPGESLYGRIDALKSGKTWKPSNGTLTINPSSLILIK